MCEILFVKYYNNYNIKQMTKKQKIFLELQLQHNPLYLISFSRNNYKQRRCQWELFPLATSFPIGNYYYTFSQWCN